MARTSPNHNYLITLNYKQPPNIPNVVLKVFFKFISLLTDFQIVCIENLSMNKGQKTKSEVGQGGAVMVEAAIVLPFFIVILFITFNIMVFCFHMLRFQYEVADITRQTFALTGANRALISGDNNPPRWEDFLIGEINKKATEIGLTTTEPASPSSGKSEISFSPARNNCTSWKCANYAESGDVFAISITIKEPVFGANLAGISWQEISVKLKAIAFVQQAESE
jgi:hypothetical protein